ncbi:MAG: DUF1963 domain-containing protein [Pirellulales bacterium]
MEIPEFDLEHWIREFPLKKTPRDHRCGGSIVDPTSIAVIEQIRRQALARGDLGTSVLTDVFVLALGEPERRDLTKVGGVPYRSSSAPWPLAKSGKPMTFWCQFRFTESRDIFADLPGDILLVFVEDHTVSYGDPVDFVHFEWQPLGLTELIEPQDVPPPEWTFVTCYGVRHRTVDYKESRAVEQLSRVMPGFPLSDPASARRIEFVARLIGLKVGGLFTSLDADLILSDDLPGAPLCMVADIVPSSYGRYPWINHPEPIGSVHLDKATSLLLRDGFLFMVSIDDKMDLHWTIHFG